MTLSGVDACRLPDAEKAALRARCEKELAVLQPHLHNRPVARSIMGEIECHV
jgi:hypothetical protein